MAETLVAEQPLVPTDESPTPIQGLPKPADIIAAEQKFNADQAAASERERTGQVAPVTPAPTEKKDEQKPADEQKPPEVKEPTEAELVKLQLKIEAEGIDSLTEEEKVLAGKIQSAPTAKTYKIGDKVFTPEEFEKKFREERKFTTELSAEEKESVLDLYAKGLNRTEATRSINKGFQGNAQERERLKTERVAIETTARAVMGQVFKLTELRSKLEKEAGAAVDINDIYITDEASPDFGKLDMNKLDKVQDKRSATKRMTEIDIEIAGLQNDAQKAQQQLSLATLREFQENHPEFKTKEPISVVAYKILKGDPSLDEEDKIKVRQMNDDFLAKSDPERGITVEDNYQLALRMGTLVVKPSAQSGRQTEGTPAPQLNPTDIVQKIEELRRRGLQRTPGASSSIPAPSTKPTTAKQLLDHDKTTLGNNSDEFLKQHGY